jgi:casein kinase 1
MKLNDGKGWEAIKVHPTQAHLHNIAPNTSNREIHNRKPQVPRDRLNAELPKPDAARNPAGITSRNGQRRTGEPAFTPDPALVSKRHSTQDFRLPEGSTAAQFQHSAQNLPPRSGLQNGPQAATQPAQPVLKPTQEEEKPTVWQRIMKALCCAGE